MAETKKLSTYRQKRDFSQTAEPSGEREITAANRRRFVIQKHAATRLHYDLRLELDGVFKSWAVTRGPSLDPHDRRLAVEVEDHPLGYATFEGNIPKGEYGGGQVIIWDHGDYVLEQRDQDKVVVELKGSRLKGRYSLVRFRGREASHKNWLIMKL